MKNLRRSVGFTIVEVTVAAVIFTITTIGILSTLSILKRPAKISERKVQAAYLGQQILDDLRSKVDMRNWTAGPLSDGVYPQILVINGTSYSLSYVVTTTVNGSKRVDLSITWVEP